MLLEKPMFCFIKKHTLRMHLNGFNTLNESFDGLEDGFDLGFKFEERESDTFHLDPNTGVKAYEEPFLAHYVSVCSKSSSAVAQTLHYALPRSHFSDGLHANDDDKQRLLMSSLPSITDDLRTLRDSKIPSRLCSIQ